MDNNDTYVRNVWKAFEEEVRQREEFVGFLLENGYDLTFIENFIRACSVGGISYEISNDRVIERREYIEHLIHFDLCQREV